MSVTLATVTTLVRYLLGETAKSQIPGDIFSYNASSVFTLTESNATAVTAVLVNDTESGVSYTYSSSRQTVTISSALTSGYTVEIQYTYYPNYSDTEIQDFINSAIIHLSVNNFYDFTISNSMIFPDPTVVEQRLIAVVTSLLMEPNNSTIRLPDLTINVPKDLPTIDKIRKTILTMKHNSHGTFSIL